MTFSSNLNQWFNLTFFCARVFLSHSFKVFFLVLLLEYSCLFFQIFDGHVKNRGTCSNISPREEINSKILLFMLVNVFLGSIITGTTFQQLHAFLHKSPSQIPRTIDVSIPMKATFFITYIMVDGWAGIASEILRLKPLVIFHLKGLLVVESKKDRENAMNSGSVDYPENLPNLQLYFLLGLVYAAITQYFFLLYWSFLPLPTLYTDNQCIPSTL